jgi:phosphoribosylanthranilate isomerase
VEKCRLSAVQIYPNGPKGPSNGTDDFTEEVPFRVIRVIRVKDAESLKVVGSHRRGATFLLDTYRPNAHGGTGLSFDWKLVKKYIPDYRIIIAGGLDAENVGRVIEKYAPYGVDVASGVEKEPGIKDPEKIRSFILNARKASLNGAE